MKKAHLKLSISFILTISTLISLYSCKSSKSFHNSYKEIISGSILFEEYNDLTNYDADKDLKGFIEFQNIFMDSILKLPTLINELKDEADSLILNEEFYKDENLDTALWMEMQKDTSFMRLDIYPEFYFKPNFLSHGDRKEFLNFGDKISKDGFNKCFGVPKKPCMYKQIRFDKEKKYKIEIKKSNKKEIGGYNCFLIKMLDKQVPTLYYELYVTDKIKMNHNPLFNFKSFNDKGYFILEKTEYAPNHKRIIRAKTIELSY